MELYPSLNLAGNKAVYHIRPTVLKRELQRLERRLNNLSPNAVNRTDGYRNKG